MTGDEVLWSQSPSPTPQFRVHRAWHSGCFVCVDDGGPRPVRGAAHMANMTCVLEEAPVDVYPERRPVDTIPWLERSRDGQRLPTVRGIGFTPGELVGTAARSSTVGRAAYGSGSVV